ncbi:RICIN domain-containing protein [Streptomyces spectabilis]|uniref:RICIN domain-containing protein n=1 Tax=Streptomyces spectabilis TaxID=68270 RepID=UPI0013777A94|nr:ricin-type beta-trefoil lectin domain protein [Streptomyces spectabilis]
MSPNIRRALTTGAAVTIAVAATVSLGLGSSAAQPAGKPDVPKAAAKAAVESADEIAQGGRYRIVSERYEALDLDHSQTADGSKVQTWERNESPAQIWRFWDAGDGGHLLETTVPDGDDKVLNADTNDNTANLWKMNGANGEGKQRWRFDAVGGGWFQVRNGAGGCLTAGAAEGDQVTVKECGDDRAQLWCLESAEPKSGPTAEKGIRGEVARSLEAGQSPARAKRKPAAAGAPKRVRATADSVNTDYLIVDAAPAQASGMTGVSVHWVGQSKRNPYKTWDLIEVLDGDSRVGWEWVCPQTSTRCDGGNGATFVNSGALTPGKKYTIKYRIDAGRISWGTVGAQVEFVA